MVCNRKFENRPQHTWHDTGNKIHWDTWQHANFRVFVFSLKSGSKYWTECLKTFQYICYNTSLYYGWVQNIQGSKTRPSDRSKHLVYVLGWLLTTLTQLNDAIDTWRFSDQNFTPNELEFKATYILERQLCTHSSPTWTLEGEVCRLLVLLLESFLCQDFCIWGHTPLETVQRPSKAKGCHPPLMEAQWVLLVLPLQPVYIGSFSCAVFLQHLLALTVKIKGAMCKDFEVAPHCKTRWRSFWRPSSWP